MMSNNIPPTPRPRPPAHNRRSISASKLQASPPPPYAAAFVFPPSRASRKPFHDSSSTVTTTCDLGNSDQPQPTPDATEDWLNEKSRELTELLVKADGLIKKRENELSLTSAVCKTLYESNVSLKSKHQALLARIPNSPTRSATSSPAPLRSPLPSTPHYYSPGLPRSATDSTIGSMSTPQLRFPCKHTRKVSMTSADIALLSDQNAELLQKLEKLEAESAQADQSGRRALKRLEREIAVLREELERTQARSEELEESARLGQSVQAMWKKQEKEAEVAAVRSKLSESLNAGHMDVPIPDFAPPPQLSSSVKGGPQYRRSSRMSMSELRPFPSAEVREVEEPAELDQATAPYTPPSPISTPTTPSKPESALISQLLLKIKELEETNTRIIQQQAETAGKLQAVQRETENMSKVYECLNDSANVEWEVVQDDQEKQDRKTPGSNNTIRFRSLRRTLALDGDVTKLFQDTDINESVSRSVRDKNLPHSSHKTRKTVVGLFDPPTPAAASETVERRPLSSRSSSLPVPFPSLAFDHQPSWSEHGIISPALSTLSLSSRIDTPHDGPRRTLDSELGNFIDPWDMASANHHLRTSSLYDLSHLTSTPSSQPASRPISRVSSPPPPVSPIAEAPQTQQCTPASKLMNNNELQLTLEPPTPQPQHSNDQGQDDTPTKPGKQTMRYRRMSMTVRSRSSKWADGRFKDTLAGLGTPNEEAEDTAKSMTPIARRLVSALDAVVETFTGTNSSSGFGAKPALPASHEETADITLSHSAGPSLTRGSNDGKVENRPHKHQKHGLAKAMLEIWLWLQFAIIILVFLWAMAKRGPKSVLYEAEKRRTSPGQ